MSGDSLVLYVLASISFMLLFGAAVIVFLYFGQKKIAEKDSLKKDLELQFQKDLLLNTVKIQEAERDRISKELHDDITSKLNIVYLNLQQLQDVVTKQKESEELFEKIETGLNKAINRIRELSYQLVPHMLNKFGIQYYLKELVESVENTSNFTISLNNEDLIKVKDELKLLHLFRIVQELLNNAIKHSQADKIIISFQEYGDQLEMLIADDGIGYTLEKGHLGAGLNNVLTRAALLKGNVSFDSSMGKGFMITLKFPNHEQ